MNTKSKIKFLTYALVLSMSSASLGGCSNVRKHMDGLTYSADENDEIVVKGTIDYNSLKDYKVVELRFLDNPSQLIIATFVDGKKILDDRYIDINTGKNIYYNDNETITIINEFNLDGFLSVYDEIQESYTIEDVQRIHGKIVENYDFTTDKVLKK